MDRLQATKPFGLRQGKPVIRGTRIPVELLLRKRAEGAAIEDLLDVYPRLVADDIRAALAYATDGGRCVTGYEQITAAVPAAGRRFRAYTAKHLSALAERAGLESADRLAVQAVATVLPFRTNSYVLDCLIDWDAAPDDPIYRLVFPQPDMLPEADVRILAGLLSRGAPEHELSSAARAVRMRLNPHPAGQLALNIPALADEPVPGIQHKYPETV